jgi:nucleoside-diphosphate-sugar epimerase
MAESAAAGGGGGGGLYLITGASGFLGYHLVRQLVEDGKAVKIFDLNPPGFTRTHARGRHTGREGESWWRERHRRESLLKTRDECAA